MTYNFQKAGLTFVCYLLWMTSYVQFHLYPDLIAWVELHLSPKSIWTKQGSPSSKRNFLSVFGLVEKTGIVRFSIRAVQIRSVRNQCGDNLRVENETWDEGNITK